MNFLFYLFIAVLGTCVLTFGVLGLFVNRFFKRLSPLFKAFRVMHKSEHNSYSNAASPRRSFFDKRDAEDVAFEELA